jgi:hypothetical protein
MSEYGQPVNGPPRGLYPFPVGRYGPLSGGHNAGSAQTLDRLVLQPFMAPERFRFDKVGSYISTAAASAVFRLGLYAASDIDGHPAELIEEFGTIDASTLGWKELDCDITVEEGEFYYWASALQGAAGAVGTRGIPLGPYGLGDRGACYPEGTPPNVTSPAYWTATKSAVSGAFPDPFDGAMAQGTVVGGLVRRAAL